jgi:protein phosphatase
MAREPLLRIASRHRCPAVAIVFDLPASLCREHDQQRRDRQVGPEVIRKQMAEMHASLPALEDEGFERVFRLASAEDVAAATVVRETP